MESGDFERKSTGFLNWFQSLPGATFHKDIRIADLRCQNAGRGILATADIEPDTVLFTIPRKNIICTSTSDLPRKLPDVFADVGIGNTAADDGGSDIGGDEDGSVHAQDSWTSLILVLVYEHLRGEKSRWKPYLDILPSSFETPMFWTNEQLKELQASPVIASVGRKEADRMIRENILSVVQSHEGVFFADGKVLGEEDLMILAHRMGSAIMSYAFDLEGDGDENDEEEGWVEDREGRSMMGMVPMADVLNADADFNAHIDHSEEALVATSLRKIRAGEEILNYYGPLPNGQLCRRYGYTTLKHSRYDVAEVAWDAVLIAVLSRVGITREEWEETGEQASRLNDEDSDSDVDDDEDNYLLERQCDDPDEFGQLTGKPEFAELPAALLERIKGVLQKVKKQRPDAVSDKKVRDRIILEAVGDALDAKLAEYGTTLEDDEKLLRGLQGGEYASRDRRLKMALDVRIGEKTLLREAKKWAAGRLERLRAQVVSQDEPAAKKRRRG